MIRSSSGGIALSVEGGGVEVVAWGGEGGEWVGGMGLGEVWERKSAEEGVR